MNTLIALSAPSEPGDLAFSALPDAPVVPGPRAAPGRLRRLADEHPRRAGPAPARTGRRRRAGAPPPPRPGVTLTPARPAGAQNGQVGKVTLQSIADRVGVSRMTVSNAFSRPDQLSADLRERILAHRRGARLRRSRPGRPCAGERAHGVGRPAHDRPAPRPARRRLLRRVPRRGLGGARGRTAPRSRCCPGRGRPAARARRRDGRDHGLRLPRDLRRAPRRAPPRHPDRHGRPGAGRRRRQRERRRHHRCAARRPARGRPRPPAHRDPHLLARRRPPTSTPSCPGASGWPAGARCSTPPASSRSSARPPTSTPSALRGGPRAARAPRPAHRPAVHRRLHRPPGDARRRRPRAAGARRRLRGRLRRHPLRPHRTPPLTTVRQDVNEKGRRAARHARGRGRAGRRRAEPERFLLPVELVVRGTTAPPPPV